MTYFDVVDIIRNVYENADARSIYEHIAVQVDIVGEGAGSLYVEVAERSVCVEPYDYKDRDILVITDAKTVVDLAEGNLLLDDAISAGRFQIMGNKAKIELMRRIVI